MQAQDAVKLLYQSEFGGGHMIADEAESLRRLEEEQRTRQENSGRRNGRQEQAQKGQPDRNTSEPERAETNLLGHQVSVCCMQEPSFEEIGDGLCRVFLSVLDRGLSSETLNRMFVMTANKTSGTIENFEKKLDALRQCCRQGKTPFSPEELEAYIKEYKAHGYPPVSHSALYREHYRPSYRVVADRYARYLEAFIEIDRVMKNASDTVVAAIDGMCGAGKSTMGQALQEIYGCRLFHMDDYFLRPEQRTSQRYAQPGGNVDYERFNEEVLDHIRDREGLDYRPFDCGTFTLGTPVETQWSPLNIVEGSYSQHPFFGDVYELRFFCRISCREQIRRIRARNGEQMLRRFQEQWIPMENRYFEAFEIEKKSISAISPR